MHIQQEKLEQAVTGEFPVSILGNAATEDFELVDVGGPDLPLEDIRAMIAARKLYFFGAISHRDGVPSTYLEDEPPSAMIVAMVQAYRHHVATKRFNETLEVFELRCLYARPDPRK